MARRPELLLLLLASRDAAREKIFDFETILICVSIYERAPLTINKTKSGNSIAKNIEVFGGWKWGEILWVEREKFCGWKWEKWKS